MRRPSSPSCAPRSSSSPPSSPPPEWLSDEEQARARAPPPLPSLPAPLSPSSSPPFHSLTSCRTSPPSPPSPRLPPFPSRPDAPLPSPYAHTHPSLRTPHASTAAEESFTPPRPPARASPPPRLPSARAKPIGLLVGALALLVLASTLWSALGLRPAFPSRPPPRDWAMPPDGEAPPLYSRISEELLLWQLVRAFLAAPWLLPDAGSTRTLRPPPPGGWAVAVEEGEEEEEGEAVEIADSASLLLTRRMKRPAPYAWEERGGAYGGQEKAGGANEEWGWGGGEGRAWGGGEGRTSGGRLEEGEVPAVDGAAGGEGASFGEEVEAVGEGGEEVEAVGEGGEEVEAGGGSESGAEREPNEAAADGVGESDAAGVEEYLRVVDSGVEVAILYKGPSDSSGGRYLSLCSGDWLCASAWHSHRDESSARTSSFRRTSYTSRAAAFPYIAYRPHSAAFPHPASFHHNAPFSDSAAFPHSATSSPPFSFHQIAFSLDAAFPLAAFRFTSFSQPPLPHAAPSHPTASGHLLRSRLRPSAAPWFALQSVANGQLVEVAPSSDPEAWVIRARGGGGGGGGGGVLLVGRYAQWREEGGGLRNRGSGGLLNFRGGVAVRAHGDGAAAARPCVRHSRRTRFQLVAAEARAEGGEEGCVALGVATRSREGEALPLFSVLLPSLVATIANGSRLRFEVHVGYDDDDPFWREEANVEEARRRAAALTAGRRVTLHTAELRGMRGAPCWVWSALFNRSCAGGCEYFYQLNDDIRLLSPGWAEEFVRTLRSNAYLPNFGIVGPLDTNNPRLMTQSFTHCTHRDIFGYYYPPEFRNWYSDDWATQVYGRRNTFWRKDLEVSHELATRGPRYDVAYEDKTHLAAQVAKGREVIGAYVAKHHPQLRAFKSLLSKREMIAVVPE
ncbi:hypothetical protein AB1Y20_012833 [Prymnesium parvum]|uniref:Hexosyltransferase n=1 Tax=Prymnesium parvum TaxID=97485 RepID=A0AB34IJQ1_PRYPA